MQLRLYYHLRRPLTAGSGTVLFVMLNPSTADGERDDPTIRRCLGFAMAWGYGVLEVVNLFALRATDLHELARHPDPVGPRNDRAIEQAAIGADLLVCAWGAHGDLRGRNTAVRPLLAGCDAHVLGVTKDGHPRHPLYLPADTMPEPWRVR